MKRFRSFQLLVRDVVKYDFYFSLVELVEYIINIEISPERVSRLKHRLDKPIVFVLVGKAVLLISTIDCP